jgi:hypothetical protein
VNFDVRIHVGNFELPNSKSLLSKSPRSASLALEQRAERRAVPARNTPLDVAVDVHRVERAARPPCSNQTSSGNRRPRRRRKSYRTARGNPGRPGSSSSTVRRSGRHLPTRAAERQAGCRAAGRTALPVSGLWCGWYQPARRADNDNGRLAGGERESRQGLRPCPDRPWRETRAPGDSALLDTHGAERANLAECLERQTPFAFATRVSRNRRRTASSSGVFAIAIDLYGDGIRN